MMIFMRTHMKTFMWVIICLVVPSFIAVFGYQGVQQRRAVRPAFLVNGLPFTEQAWTQEIQNLRQRIQQQMGQDYDPAAIDDALLRKQAFNTMINRAIVNAKIEQLGLVTTDPEVSEFIQRNYGDPQTGRFDREAYLRELRRMRMVPADFEESIRDQLTLEKLEQLIGHSALVTEREVEEAHAEFSPRLAVGFIPFSVDTHVKDVTATQAELRDYFQAHQERFTKLPEVVVGQVSFEADAFSGRVEASTPELEVFYEQHSAEYALPARAKAEYIRFDGARFRDLVAVDPAEVERYYQENPDRFRSPEKRRIRYVQVDLEKQMETLEVPTEEAREYYNAHRSIYAATPEEVAARHILLRVAPDAGRPVEAAALERIHQIMDQIESGTKTFEAAAKEYSEDTSNAARGGDLGHFTRGRMVPPFEEAAFAAAVGEVTGPVRTAFGWHLIEVYDHRAEVVRSFEEVEGEVKAQLARQRSREAARARMDALRARLAAGELDFQNLGPDWPVMEPAPFPRNATEIDPRLARGDVFVLSRAAFQLMLPGNALSDVVEGSRHAYLLELVEVVGARPLELEEARDEVRRVVAEDRAASLARVEAHAALARIRSSTEGWAAARIEHATWLAETRLFGGQDYLFEFGAAGEDFKRTVLGTPRGEVGLVEGEQIAYVFYVMEKQEERIPSFAEVADQVRDAYRQVQRGEVARDAAIQLWNEVARGEERVGRLAEVVVQMAPEKGWPVRYEELEPFRLEDPPDPSPEYARELRMLREPGDAGYAVIHEDLPGRDRQAAPAESGPIARVVVVELQKSLPKRLPEFEEVQDEVEEAVLAEKAAPLARAEAQRTLDEIKAVLDAGRGRNASGEVDLPAIAREKGYTYIETQPFSRWNPPSELGYFSLAFNRTAAELSPGQISGVVEASELVQPAWRQDEPEGMGPPTEWPTRPRRFMILCRVQLASPVEDLDDEQRIAIRNQLVQQKRNALFQEWLRRENEKADVVVRIRPLLEVAADRENVRQDLYGDQLDEEEEAA